MTFNRFLAVLAGMVIGLSLLGGVQPVSALTVAQQARCDLATTRIDLLITRYSNNKDRHVERYVSARNKIITLVEKLEGKGYDVTKITTDLKTWDGMIKKMSTDYNIFVDSLNLTKQYTCAQSQGDFKTQLKDAQSKLATVKQSSLDTRLFYQQTIRTDIEELKSQK